MRYDHVELRVLGFNEWKKGLIEDDKREGLHPVKRRQQDFELLFSMYKKAQYSKEAIAIRKKLKEQKQ